jgi:hypothetical protein
MKKIFVMLTATIMVLSSCGVPENTIALTVIETKPSFAAAGAIAKTNAKTTTKGTTATKETTETTKKADTDSEENEEISYIVLDAYNSYDDNGITFLWESSLEGGIFTIYISNNGKDFKKLTTVKDKYSYEYTKDFTKKYFKIKQQIDDVTLESTMITVEKTESGYYKVTYQDTDEDGFPDYIELLLKTDSTKADTDDDGLSDYDEILVFGSDPLVYDSIKPGVSDSEADTDDDGLSNIDEMKLGTDPLDDDTDYDNLKDGDEIKKHKTDPLKHDTDNDGIADGDELKLKLDPLKKFSNGKTPDNERIFKQTIKADHKLFKYVNSQSDLKFSVEIKAAGFAENNLSVSESGYSGVMGQNRAIIGFIPEFEYTRGLTVKEFKLGVKMSDELVKNADGSSDDPDDEFDGINRYQFFRYFEEINILLPVETTFDESNNMMYTTTTDLGTYCVMDLDIWLSDLKAALG